MITLYTLPGTCSTGIHTLLHMLEIPFNWVNKNAVDNYLAINPVGSVPLLQVEDRFIREGAAIVLYLLDNYDNNMLPKESFAKAEFLQNLFFNYATLHPAYGRLFFALNSLSGHSQQMVFQQGALDIERLWRVVDNQLNDRQYVGGDTVSIIDVMLAIYANWGTFFTVEIELGDNVKRLISKVIELPEFKKAYDAEGLSYQLDLKSNH